MVTRVFMRVDISDCLKGFGCWRNRMLFHRPNFDKAVAVKAINFFNTVHNTTFRSFDMNFTQKRWLTLFASCLINLCIGSIYAWSVFASPMAAYFNELHGTGLTAGSLAVVFTAANAVGPITMISGGSINDRLGPQRVILIGGLLFGGGMFFSSFVTNTTALIITFGLGCGLGMGMVYGCTIGSCVKAFPDMRGLVGGIATATYGFSSVLVPPIANAVIRTAGITSAFKTFGVIFLFVICGASLLVRPCPQGFIPDGWIPPTTAQKAGGEEKNWRKMLASSSFYFMIIMLTCGAVAGLMTISQASPIAQNTAGLSASSASVAVSVLALFNVTGRIAAGYLSDKIGRIQTLTCAFLLSILGLTLLIFTTPSRTMLFYAGIAAVGVCFGALMGIFPGFTADQFGARNNTVNYGIMFIGFAFAGLIGPSIMNHIYSTTGAYTWAFLFAACLNLLGLVLSLLGKKYLKLM